MKKIVLYLLVFISSLNLFSMELGDTTEFEDCNLSKEEAERLLDRSSKHKLSYTEIDGEEIVLEEANDLEAGQNSDIMPLMSEFTFLDRDENLTCPNELLAIILKYIPLNEQNFKDFFRFAAAAGLDSINRKRLELFAVGIMLDSNSNSNLRKYLELPRKKFENSVNNFKHIVYLHCFLNHIQCLCKAIESDLNYCRIRGIEEYFTTNLNFIKKQFQQHEKKDAYLLELRDIYKKNYQSLLKSKYCNPRIYNVNRFIKLSELLKSNEHMSPYCDNNHQHSVHVAIVLILTLIISIPSLYFAIQNTIGGIMFLSFFGSGFIFSLVLSCYLIITNLQHRHYKHEVESIPESISLEKLTIFKEQLDTLIRDLSNQLNDLTQIEFDL